MRSLRPVWALPARIMALGNINVWTECCWTAESCLLWRPCAGMRLLHVWRWDPEGLHRGSGGYPMRCGNSFHHHSALFLMWNHGSFSWRSPGNGHSGVPMILSIIGTVVTRIVWIFWIFPQHRSLYTLFISYPASWFITIVLQVVCFVFVRQTVHGQLKGTGKAAWWKERREML